MKWVLFVSFVLLPQLGFANSSEVQIVISSDPKYGGGFSEVFSLVCSKEICKVEKSGPSKKKGSIKYEKISSELKSLLSIEDSGNAVHRDKRPQTIVRQISYSSPGKKFETHLGTIFDKSTNGVKAYGAYNKALDDLIRSSTKALK